MAPTPCRSTQLSADHNGRAVVNATVERWNGSQAALAPRPGHPAPPEPRGGRSGRHRPTCACGPARACPESTRSPQPAKSSAPSPDPTPHHGHRPCSAASSTRFSGAEQLIRGRPQQPMNGASNFPATHLVTTHPVPPEGVDELEARPRRACSPHQSYGARCLGRPVAWSLTAAGCELGFPVHGWPAARRRPGLTWSQRGRRGDGGDSGGRPGHGCRRRSSTIRGADDPAGSTARSQGPDRPVAAGCRHL